MSCSVFLSLCSLCFLVVEVSLVVLSPELPSSAVSGLLISMLHFCRVRSLEVLRAVSDPISCSRRSSVVGEPTLGACERHQCSWFPAWLRGEGLAGVGCSAVSLASVGQAVMKPPRVMLRQDSPS